MAEAVFGQYSACINRGTSISNARALLRQEACFGFVLDCGRD
jgi:hypothetical protein